MSRLNEWCEMRTHRLIGAGLLLFTVSVAFAGDSVGLATTFCDGLVDGRCEKGDAICARRERTACGKSLADKSLAQTQCEILVAFSTLSDNLATCVQTMRKEGQAIYDANK
jgi:hypothetical protein